MTHTPLIIDIYEDNDPTPVIGHIFYGSPSEQKRVIEAHMGTDSFFNAAMLGKKFRGMRLSVDRYYQGER